DRILVHGRKIKAAEKVYLMMNKPRGIVTSARDEKGRDTVYSLLPEYGQWLAPVGRLDKASEGLLLITNDSQWAARISSPDAQVEKTYHVQIGTVAKEGLIRELTNGIKVEGEVLRRSEERRVGKGCSIRV